MTKWTKWASTVVLAWTFQVAITNPGTGMMIQLVTVGAEMQTTIVAGNVFVQMAGGFDTKLQCDRAEGTVTAQLVEQARLYPGFSFQTRGCIEDQVQGRRPR